MAKRRNWPSIKEKEKKKREKNITFFKLIGFAKAQITYQLWLCQV